MKETKALKKARALEIIELLKQDYPVAQSELDYQNPLQCMIATILSAQCTDVQVNKVTPSLFKKYPTVQAFAHADREELENVIRSTGFFRQKAKSIQNCCTSLLDRFNGTVPNTIEELISLEGVGRKTANCVICNAFGQPGVMVDTHVKRLSNRMGFTTEKNPDKIEMILKDLWPRDQWSTASHVMILHGRRVCSARKPQCSTCSIQSRCPKIAVDAKP